MPKTESPRLVGSSALLDGIRTARNNLRKAEAMKCTCSGFVLQYEGGCQCEQRLAIIKAQRALNDAINAI